MIESEEDLDILFENELAELDDELDESEDFDNALSNLFSIREKNASDQMAQQTDHDFYDLLNSSNDVLKESVVADVDILEHFQDVNDDKFMVTTTMTDIPAAIIIPEIHSVELSPEDKDVLVQLMELMIESVERCAPLFTFHANTSPVVMGPVETNLVIIDDLPVDEVTELQTHEFVTTAVQDAADFSVQEKQKSEEEQQRLMDAEQRQIDEALRIDKEQREVRRKRREADRRIALEHNQAIRIQCAYRISRAKRKYNSLLNTYKLSLMEAQAAAESERLRIEKQNETRELNQMRHIEMETRIFLSREHLVCSFLWDAVIASLLHSVCEEEIAEETAIVAEIAAENARKREIQLQLEREREAQRLKEEEEARAAAEFERQQIELAKQQAQQAKLMEYVRTSSSGSSGGSGAGRDKSLIRQGSGINTLGDDSDDEHGSYSGSDGDEPNSNNNNNNNGIGSSNGNVNSSGSGSSVRKQSNHTHNSQHTSTATTGTTSDITNNSTETIDLGSIHCTAQESTFSLPDSTELRNCIAESIAQSTLQIPDLWIQELSDVDLFMSEEQAITALKQNRNNNTSNIDKNIINSSGHSEYDVLCALRSWQATNLDTAQFTAERFVLLDENSISATGSKSNNNSNKVDELKINSEDLTNVQFLRDHTTLRKLNISVNRIVSLQGIEPLTQLEELSLNDNKLVSVRELSFLTALRTLSLDLNRVSDLAAAMGNRHSQLTFLSANANQLSSLPNLSQCPVLQRLELHHNKIAEVPYDIHCPVPATLTHLDLSANKLRFISGLTLSQCPLLQTLILSQNALTEVPYPLHLPLLKVLWLNRNNITSLEHWQHTSVSIAATNNTITMMNNANKTVGSGNGNKNTSTAWPLFTPMLQKLYLQDNQVASISPAVLSTLPLLLELDLSFNAIAHRDALCSVAEARSLTSISVQDNPLFRPHSTDPTDNESPALLATFLIDLCPILLKISNDTAPVVTEISLDKEIAGLLGQRIDPLCAESGHYFHFLQMLRSMAANTHCMAVRQKRLEIKIQKEKINNSNIKAKSSQQSTSSSSDTAASPLEAINCERELYLLLINQLDMVRHFGTQTPNSTDVAYFVDLRPDWVSVTDTNNTKQSETQRLVTEQQQQQQQQQLQQKLEQESRDKEVKRQEYITRCHHSAVHIQKVARGFLFRRRYRRAMRGIQYQDTELDDILHRSESDADLLESILGGSEGADMESQSIPGSRGHMHSEQSLRSNSGGTDVPSMVYGDHIRKRQGIREISGISISNGYSDPRELHYNEHSDSNPASTSSSVPPFSPRFNNLHYHHSNDNKNNNASHNPSRNMLVTGDQQDWDESGGSVLNSLSKTNKTRISTVTKEVRSTSTEKSTTTSAATTHNRHPAPPTGRAAATKGTHIVQSGSFGGGTKITRVRNGQKAVRPAWLTEKPSDEKDD